MLASIHIVFNTYTCSVYYIHVFLTCYYCKYLLFMQSEVPDIGGTKREVELERELGIEKDHVTSLQERIATMKEGLQEERIKAKDKEKLHKQELERERAQVKALTDDRANLERKHKHEVARLKVCVMTLCKFSIISFILGAME